MLFELFPNLLPCFDALTWVYDVLFALWSFTDLLLN